MIREKDKLGENRLKQGPLIMGHHEPKDYDHYQFLFTQVHKEKQSKSKQPLTGHFS